MKGLLPVSRRSTQGSNPFSGISINGAFATHTPASGCGSTETLTTGGSFQITDGQDVIFGSGEPTISGYYFVYGLYSP